MEIRKTQYDIQKYFANLSRNRSIRMNNDNKNSYWVIRRNDEYGVAIELAQQVSINESFATAKYYASRELLSDGKYHFLLVLENSNEQLRNEFAYLCAHFVDPGEEGVERRIILENPYEWWKKWRDLLGNAIQKKKPYAILGELIVYERLIRKGKKPNWGGEEFTIHDISTNDEDYEVKSTLNRFGLVIEISSQFQLRMQQKRKLVVCFCRFEENDTGKYCIDEVVEALVSLGIDKIELEKRLSQMGYPFGAYDRRKSYTLYDEIFCFPVDEQFPRIIPESFKENQIPRGIEKITYTVNLNGLKYELL